MQHNHQYACGLLHEAQCFTPRPLASPSSSNAPLPSSPQVFLITAAAVGDGLISSPIGWRRQLRTADGEFVNDLDSSQSSGRVFTSTRAVFAADQLCFFALQVNVKVITRNAKSLVRIILIIQQFEVTLKSIFTLLSRHESCK